MPENVVWGPGRKADFETYLFEELNRTLRDRADLERKWSKWLDQYRAPATTAVKEFPWTGASNRTLPFTAMNADPLIARFMTLLTAPPNFWTIEALSETWTDAAKPMQDYLQFLADRQLNLQDVLHRAVLEFVKLGTCVLKHGWTFERRNKLVYGPDGQLVRGQEMVSKPFVDHVSLIDFLLPAEAYQIQPDMQGGASWIAERFWLRKEQLLARAKGQAPFLPDYDPEATQAVSQYEQQTSAKTGSGSDVESTRWTLDTYSPSHLRRIELFEVHARFDTQGDDSVDDIVAVFHMPSRKLLRAIINPYKHGARPYSVARYFRSDGFYGIGECEQSEVFQEMLTLLWNYQMDNVLAVNAPMIGVKLGANVVPNEPIYPLKQWILDDPSKDIREIKLSEVYPSLPTFSAIIQGWGERRTGINDITRGDPSQIPSRTPATSLISLLQEGNRRIDLSLNELREMLGEVGIRTLQNCQQFMSNPVQNPQAAYQLQMTIQTLGEPEGQYVAEKLILPLEDIELGLGVSVAATTSTVNKDVEKQNFLNLLNLNASLFVPIYLQLSQILGSGQLQLMSPVVVKTAEQLFTSTAELQKRLYERFDIRNLEDVLVDASILVDFAHQTAPQAQVLALAGAAAAIGGNGDAGQAGGNGGVGGVSKPAQPKGDGTR